MRATQKITMWAAGHQNRPVGWPAHSPRPMFAWKWAKPTEQK